MWNTAIQPHGGWYDGATQGESLWGPLVGTSRYIEKGGAEPSKFWVVQELVETGGTTRREGRSPTIFKGEQLQELFKSENVWLFIYDY